MEMTNTTHTPRLTERHTPGPLKSAFVNGYRQALRDFDQIQKHTMAKEADAWESYAIAAAEGDLLGEALAILKLFEDTDSITPNMRMKARAVLAKAGR